MIVSEASYERYQAPFPSHLAHEQPWALQEPLNGWMTIPYEIREFSLIFVVDRDRRRSSELMRWQVLLGRKRRGVGVGLFNGFGGKPEPGENIRQCAVRELEEESGLVPIEEASIQRVGGMVLSRPKYGSREIFRIVLFACTAWRGNPIETDEMTPEWFDIPSEAILLLSDNAEGVQAVDQGYPLSQTWPEAKLFHLPLLHRILSNDPGHAGQLTAQLEYDYVDPYFREPWTLIRPEHSNDPNHEGETQEALTGWCFAWSSDDRS